MNAGWRVYCMCQKYFRSQLVFICYVHTFTNSSSFWGANMSHFCHLYKRILHFILDPTNSWSILDQVIACCLFGGILFNYYYFINALNRHIFQNIGCVKYTYKDYTWWSHQIETVSALLAICAGNSPVPGEFPAHRPVARSFGIFFDLRLNKRLSKQWWGWWFDTPWRPSWRHCNELLRSLSVNMASDNRLPAIEPMNMCCQRNPYQQISVNFEWKHSHFPPNE